MRRHRATQVVTVVLAVALPLMPSACATSSPSVSPHPAVSRSGPSSGHPDTAPVPKLSAGGPAWISVSVATLWRTPRSPRKVDAPALAAPARVGRWLDTMSVEERRGLSGRADTQALLGERVRVVRLRAHWARVAVPSQPVPGRRGYPGWVPRRQLTATPPLATDRVATVLRRTAWVRDDSDGRRLYRLSFGTRLPVLAERPTFVRAASPTGRVLRLAPTAVTVHDRADAALAPDRTSVVRTARSFLGLPYLWAGTSGFGLDCSGLTWLTYRVHGIRIPRDAAPQSEDGLPVTQARRGDLLFYGRSGDVHHVAMSIGRGRMVHAPGTGDVVRVSNTSATPYAEEYAGSRRYVP